MRPDIKADLLELSPQQLATDLLAGLGGEPCHNLDDDRPGIWLPIDAWQHIGQLARNSEVALSIALCGREVRKAQTCLDAEAA